MTPTHRVPGAKRFERLDYREVLARDLQVMDASAISLARENRIPILVFSIFENGGFAEVVQGKGAVRSSRTCHNPSFRPRLPVG